MTKNIQVRKYFTFVDEVLREGETVLDSPIKRSVAVAVIKNPYVNIYKQDLSKLYDYGEFLGEELSERAVDALGVKGESVESYGKGVVVGTGGEIEQGHAIIHPKIGGPFRKSIGGADKAGAIIPSTAKMGTLGVTIDIPVHFKASEWVISHVDTITITLPDAPYSDEIAVALAVTTKGRPLSRLPGLSKEEVK